MIYLFDDKIVRQEGYGWTTELFERYIDSITPVYRISELSEETKRKKIFSQGNIILFHESFFDAEFNKHYKESIEIRKSLETFASQNQNFFLVFFSGSKSSRSLEKNVAYLPVTILYQNLEEFIKKLLLGRADLNFLLYGKNPNIEQDLVDSLAKANNSIEINENFNLNTNDNILIARSIGQTLAQFINGADYILLTDDSNRFLHSWVIEWLSKIKYNKLFIPLCFGTSLSDFNGLRLAVHIRCTETLNQCTPIVIYSFLSINEIVDNEYFNILKTKNVQIIDYSVKAFVNSVNLNTDVLKISELPQELKKLKLDIPDNYIDNHSISNEWAIYRWSKAICADENSIDRIYEKVNSQLYFKYLTAIFPNNEIPIVDIESIKILKHTQPRILYIDDDAEKGWYEIICKILSDINGIRDIEYLGDELKIISQSEIIELTISKIKEQNTDLVILDFRLHPNDFIEHNILEITGIKILRRIKAINPGIQVIIFSATNKIWNLQALQNENSDGFIIKESPENSDDSGFTLNAINNFVSVIKKCTNKIFLKDFYTKLENLKIALIPRKNFQKSENPLPKDFVDETLKWFELSCEILQKETNQSMIASSFIILFSILENISNRVINIDNPIAIDVSTKPQLYMFEFRGTNQKLKRFQEDETNVGIYRRTNGHLKSTRNIPWKFKILNALDFITENKLKEEEINSLIKKRNDLIHANNTTGDKIDISVDTLIALNSIIYNGLINIK